jgi:hypothetical protein
MALIGSRMHGLIEQEEMPEDVTEMLEQLVPESKDVTLDDRLLALLDQVAPRETRERISHDGLADLSDNERRQIAIDLMRHFNKVTHIFELVKAYGSTSQVEYNRTERSWVRRENIAAKHEFEVAVNLISGQKLTGDEHAPLVYAQDPRMDVPAELQRRLMEAIEGADEKIVRGWMVD